MHFACLNENTNKTCVKDKVELGQKLKAEVTPNLLPEQLGFLLQAVANPNT